MTDNVDKVPKHHGEFYFEPSLPQWREEALRNRDRLAQETFWGQSPRSVRAALKMPTDQPLILSGHQPVFFYPGLWTKCLAASALAQAVSGAAYHKLTDTALAPEFLHYLPELEDNGRARRKQLDFFSSKDAKEVEKAIPYAFLPAPEYPALEKIFADAQVFCPPVVKENMSLYGEKMLKGLRENTTWNNYHIFTLKWLDEICGVKRMYMEGSKIWSSESFLEFLGYWFNHLPELTDHYNHSLDEYRKSHNIQHELSPMPNLKFQDWFFEIPFWGITHYHQRHSVWAKIDGKKLVLKIKGADGNYTVNLANLREELGTLPITLWPKAIPQTLFCRMFLCDYFIHGLGGGIYEEVGNMFFEKVFKVKPLAFGVATSTYLVDPKDSHGIEVILEHEAMIENWQRLLAKNPEYLFTKQEAWEKELPAFMHEAFKKCLNNETLQKGVQVKLRLLEELKDPAKKAEASKKIKEINFALYDHYTEILKVLEQGLLDASKVKESRAILAYREYPFFCYKPEVFVEMTQKIKRIAGL